MTQEQIDLDAMTPEELRSLRGKVNARLIRRRSGGRQGGPGRNPRPTFCRLCGQLQPSAALARTHCKKVLDKAE